MENFTKYNSIKKNQKFRYLHIQLGQTIELLKAKCARN